MFISDVGTPLENKYEADKKRCWLPNGDVFECWWWNGKPHGYLWYQFASGIFAEGFVPGAIPGTKLTVYFPDKGCIANVTWPEDAQTTTLEKVQYIMGLLMAKRAVPHYDKSLKVCNGYVEEMGWVGKPHLAIEMCSKSHDLRA